MSYRCPYNHPHNFPTISRRGHSVSTAPNDCTTTDKADFQISTIAPAHAIWAGLDLENSTAQLHTLFLVCGFMRGVGPYLSANLYIPYYQYSSTRSPRPTIYSCSKASYIPFHAVCIQSYSSTGYMHFHFKHSILKLAQQYT